MLLRWNPKPMIHFFNFTKEQKMHTQNTHTDGKPEEMSSSKNADASALESKTNDKLPQFYKRAKNAHAKHTYRCRT